MICLQVYIIHIFLFFSYPFLILFKGLSVGVMLVPQALSYASLAGLPGFIIILIFYILLLFLL